jgi:hypothetical protein
MTIYIGRCPTLLITRLSAFLKIVFFRNRITSISNSKILIKLRNCFEFFHQLFYRHFLMDLDFSFLRCSGLHREKEKFKDTKKGIKQDERTKDGL